jgi:hypothetical protein
MPVIKVKDPQGFRETMGAGYGFYIHPDEDIEWTAPDAAPFDALGKEIKSHKDEIYRIAQTMALGVENNAAAVGRSSESKAADQESTRVVMLAYARVAKETIERIYDLIGRARGDDYVWAVDGLDDFAADDLSGMVEVLQMVQDSGGIPSKTFNVEVKSRLAESLLQDLSEEHKATIRKEIEEGTEDQSTEARQAREKQRMDAISKNLNTETAQAKAPKQSPQAA